MQIDRLSQYGGFYNQYKVPEINQVSVDDIKKQEIDAIQKKSKEQDLNTLHQQYVSQIPSKQIEDNRSRMADLENISLNFNANDTYDYIGKDASLENLDMMSAISDMQKDKVLQQYQYFVGPQDIMNQVIASTNDGVVIQKQ